ncbi:MAG: pyruvate kinase [Coriobacteriia bacterium]|nr:pyruvate kinase [Coriobacteriia bacterium]
MPRTKIVATVGPASEDPSVLRRMIAAGASVVRLNASHGTRADLGRRLETVREIAADAGRHVAVMLDLSGPKLRIGEVSPGVVLERGARFELVAEQCVGDRQRVCLTHPEVIADVPPGARVLIDDGRVELQVESRDGSRLVTVVVTGGPLSSHKGVNVPGVRLSLDAITAKDREDLAWGLDAGVDFVAQSFVRGPDDVEALRALMGEQAVPIVAKIEKHEAVERLEAIVEAADAVMVARGDLGVETATEQVPLIQRRMVALAREHGKPVIVATQMLESMVSSPRPTRAEASDVANAIFEQADAVMLSAETAVGAYPVEAVETMARIAEAAEREVEACGTEAPPRAGRSDVARAVSAAACEIARVLDLAAIVTATQSGATARAVAAHRPKTPIVAATPDERVARRVALVWGVEPLVVPQHGSIDEMLAHAIDAVRKAGFAREGELVALTAGVAVGVPGTTNLVQVTQV